jgi:hypothetical protein
MKKGRAGTMTHDYKRNGNRIRRGVFKSVAELKAAIADYLQKHNADPKPFVWTKSAGEILEKVARAKQALESQH